MKQALIPSNRRSNRRYPFTFYSALFLSFFFLFFLFFLFPQAVSTRETRKRNGCESGRVHRRTINEIACSIILLVLAVRSHRRRASSPKKERTLGRRASTRSLTFVFAKQVSTIRGSASTTIREKEKKEAEMQSRDRLQSKKKTKKNKEGVSRWIVRSRNSRSRISYSIVDSSNVQWVLVFRANYATTQS